MNPEPYGEMTLEQKTNKEEKAKQQRDRSNQSTSHNNKADSEDAAREWRIM